MSALLDRVREHVPAQLLQLPVWLLWKKNDEGKKLPYYADGTPRRGTLDSPEDRSHLVTFETAAAALNGEYAGLGVALGEVPGEEIRISGADFDHCYKNDSLDERVQNVMLAAASYTEKSPGGDGVHVVGTGDIGTVKKDANGLEIYSGGRFFTMTGDALNGAGLADLTDAARMARELFGVNREQDTNSVKTDNGDARAYVGKGARNSYLSDEAFRFRKQGMNTAQILEALRGINAARCRPPLGVSELEAIARGKENIKPDAPPGGWEPPAVATYGAAFDPANIPLRRWLLGRRRSIGEMTVDAGPPGVNKSTLMLSDAVQIITGRQILADKVHETGGVLYLAGEDARRDIEARLAGILERYHITPAELANRLHVVYLAEVDPAAYTLAQMIDDMASLNTRMIEWLREYPDLLAVFVDPLAAWHRLIENSNEALQLLCTSLRAIAVRGDRHVGVDHHVTKVAMSDSEAHVNNLAAVRGAGSIMAYTRWAFTLARIKDDTAEEYGISEDEQKRYRRLDPLKASYGPDDDLTRMLRVESVAIANGESVGVLVEVDMQRTREDAAERKKTAEEDLRRKRINALTQMLMADRPRSAQQAALWLLSHRPELFPGRKPGEPLSEFTLRKRWLPTFIGTGLDTTVDGKPTRIVMLEPETEGKGFAINFTQSGLPL